jgi:hypothetical protein
MTRCFVGVDVGRKLWGDVPFTMKVRMTLEWEPIKTIPVECAFGRRTAVRAGRCQPAAGDGTENNFFITTFSEKEKSRVKNKF